MLIHLVKKHFISNRKGFKSGNSICKIYDELYQPNAIDKDGITQAKCEKELVYG